MTSQVVLLHLQDVWRKGGRNDYHLSHALTSRIINMPMAAEKFDLALGVPLANRNIEHK